MNQLAMFFAFTCSALCLIGSAAFHKGKDDASSIMFGAFLGSVAILLLIVATTA